jgi:hypothetical protein
VDQDPTRSSPQTSFGWIYPEGDIVAVVEDRATGERAMLDLKQAGVPEGDMDLVDPAWFLAGEHAVEERRGFWQRLGAVVAQEEGDLIKEYVEEAREGHPFVVVHADDDDRAHLIRDVLRAHGARRIEYYRRYVIEDL